MYFCMSEILCKNIVEVCMMRYILSILLAFVCLMSTCACAEVELVSIPTQIDAPATSDEPVVQDMYSYMQNNMTFDTIGSNDEGAQYRKFRGGNDTCALIEEYVHVLCASGSFTLVDSYYEAYSAKDIFFSYALDYIGSCRLPGDRCEMNFKDGVFGHVTIYGLKKYSNFEGYIYVARGLEFGDLGLRIGGQTQSVALPGTSVGADLYRMDDGSYQTGDGRFHLNVGQAQIYRDGKLYTTDATLVRNQAENREEVRIYNFFRNDSIILTLPYNSVLTGDVLDRRTIGVNKEGTYEEYIDNMEAFLHWRFSDKLLGVSHDGDMLLCYHDDYNDFDDVVVRVMYWDPARDTAVFYICATFDTAPYEYETIAAVSLGATPQGANADAMFNMSVGEKMEISFSGREFMPTYELFTWEILEGSALIELTGTRGQTCTVQAYDPGTVRLKVTYEYGAKGANVLTGNPETKFMSKSCVYAIHIAP